MGGCPVTRIVCSFFSVLSLRRGALGLLAAGALVIGAEDARDWPQFRGPFANGSTADCAAPLLSDLKDAKLLWISEERNLGVGWSVRSHGASNSGRCDVRCCGYAGPVVAEGKVFQQYFVPAGDMLGYADYANKKDPRRETYLIEADDVVLCADAQTGKTLWKTVLPKGLNWGWGRNGTFVHPCVAGGRVFVQGTGGYVHALDAATGKEIWTVGTGPGSAAWDALRAKTLAAKDITKVVHSAFCVSPLFVSLPDTALVVLNDDGAVAAGQPAGSALVALDAQTGELRWRVPDAVGKMVSPVAWRHDGKTFIIGVTGKSGRTVSEIQGRMVCVDAASGAEAWQLPVGFSDSTSPVVVGDVLVASRVAARGEGSLKHQYDLGKGRKQIDPEKVSYEQWAESLPAWTAYRLSPSAPPQGLWTLNARYAGCYPPPAACGLYVYLQSIQGLLVVEPETGKIIATGPKTDCYMPLMIHGKRLFQYARMINIEDPLKPVEAGRLDAAGGFMTTVYAYSCVADGRLYVRGWVQDPNLRVGELPENGAIACFDLRRQQ